MTTSSSTYKSLCDEFLNTNTSDEQNLKVLGRLVK